MQLVVARIGRAHGIKGDVTVEVRTDEPELRLAPGAVLATDPASAGPLTIETGRVHSGRLLLRFEGVRDRTGAEALRNNILIAEHGSWNRHKYQGARIMRVIVGPDGKNAKQEVFASGWLEGDQGYLGRPNDIIIAKDGSILVADDWAGAIYRISYSKK